MTKLLAFSAVAMLGLSACGSSNGYDCAKLCDTRNACPGVTAMDCATSCPAIEQFNKTASCTNQFDSALTCIGKHEDQLCQLGQSGSTTACDTQGFAYALCASSYCTAHPTDPTCAIVGQLTGATP